MYINVLEMLEDNVRDNPDSDDVLSRSGNIPVSIAGAGDLGSISLAATGDPVVKGAWSDPVLTAPFGIAQTAPAAFVDETDLLRHRNRGFAGS